MSLSSWIGINILILVGMFFYLNRKINRRLQITDIAEKARKEINGIVIELNHATERNIALIEDKIHQLKAALEAADKRLGILRREMERNTPLTYERILQKPNNPFSPSVSEEKLSEPSLDQSSAIKKMLSREEVLDLYNKGISPSIIATKLGTTVGEIELIISLQDRKERERYTHGNTEQS